MTVFQKILMFCLLVVSSMAMANETLSTDALLTDENIATQQIEPVDPESLLWDDPFADDESLTEKAVLTLSEQTMAHDLSPWGMYQSADWVVKAVMIILLLASVLTWAIWMAKLSQFAGARHRLHQFREQLGTAGRITELVDQKRDAASEALLNTVISELTISRQQDACVDDGIKERITARLGSIQTREAGNITSGMGILATIGAVAPFVGLFGTVWGIMNSFIAIAQTQTTNLEVVAPGIAEALLATGMGLVAAIPAVVIYNHFSRATMAYRTLLAEAVTGLMVLVSRDLDRQRVQPEVLRSSDSELLKPAEVVGL